MERTIKTKLPVGRIVKISKMQDGSYEVIQKVEVHNNNFVLIEASKLSMDDNFMKFYPRKNEIKAFKKALSQVIKKGVKDFYRPIMDPSLTKDSENIFFETGNMPAVGKSYDWWERVAKEFNPERGSRLGTKSEYIAFLGVLIKTLVSNGWSKSKAWNAVCINSEELGHYWNIEDASNVFEPTGSREVVGFYDLANTLKILAKDSQEEVGGYWLAGSDFYGISYFLPLAGIYHNSFCRDTHDDAVGWLVIEK